MICRWSGQLTWLGRKTWLSASKLTKPNPKCQRYQNSNTPLDHLLHRQPYCEIKHLHSYQASGYPPTFIRKDAFPVTPLHSPTLMIKPDVQMYPTLFCLPYALLGGVINCLVRSLLKQCMPPSTPNVNRPHSKLLPKTISHIGIYNVQCPSGK